MIRKIKLLSVNTNVVYSEKEIRVNDFGGYAHTYLHAYAVLILAFLCATS